MERVTVSSARYLRVVTFQVHGPESAVDAVLRDRVIPRLLAESPVVDVWQGRRGAADRNRVLASTWTNAVGTSASPNDRPAADIASLRSDDVEALGGVEIGSLDELPLAVHARFVRPDVARVLRVFRGHVRPGELDAYIDEAREGMTADAAANAGLVSFALGRRDPDDFITVSTWTDWGSIEAATGGNTRQPIATRNASRLAHFRVDHLELLPEAPVTRADDGPGHHDPTLEAAT